MSAIRELHDRLESTMTTVLLWLGVVVFLPLAGGMLAGGSQFPTGRLFTDGFLWSAALVCAWLASWRLARWLRERTLGDAPPREPITQNDKLGAALLLLIGPLLLYWFLPRVLELHPDSLTELLHELRIRWVDLLLVGFGIGAVLHPVWNAINYTMRR